MKKLALFLAMLFCAAFISAPLLAHHGEANYDTDKTVSVKGTVTDFQFVNPHVLVSLETKNDKGETEKWTGEARSPAMLSRYGGWDRNTIKVGDVITIYGHRTKNGTPFMRLEKIVMPDGKELPEL
jgi:DNA/RNA endonuclease YhcR with UshA esterase domain